MDYPQRLMRDKMGFDIFLVTDSVFLLLLLFLIFCLLV